MRLPVLVCYLILSTHVLAQDALENEASWQTPDVSAMRDLLDAGLREHGLEDEKIAASVELFEEEMAREHADALESFVIAASASVSGIAKVYQEALANPSSVALDPINTLSDGLRASVEAWLGRTLVQMRLYDEALPLLDYQDAMASVDPAAVLFYRAVCAHALLDKEQAITDLELLLENEGDAPMRFTRTAKLMLADIKPLKKDSLDEISRLMNDVGRRLDLGRSGEKVLTQEQEIIDKLSKLIDQIEQQQQQQQQQQQSQGGGSNSGGDPSAPMSDSRIAGAKGEGDVDKRDLGDRKGWGNLPPAERVETLQQISRDLPTHYREAIDAYFRKMAKESK